ncbi:MAG: GHMP kinase [Pseudonocardiaceae bacterium]
MVRVTPEDRTKARRAAELAVEMCARKTGAGITGGRLTLDSTVPIGWGMGSSTSDVIAAIKAVCDCYGMRLTPERIARLAVHAERASDSTMIDDRVVLFAHRSGAVLEVLGCRLPPLVVLGCRAGAAESIDTLRLPPVRYTQAELDIFRGLRISLRRAVATQDVALIGRVATASARINQRFLPKPELDLLTALAPMARAAGVQIAHSGTVAGIIFDAHLPHLAERIDRCAAVLEREGITDYEIFPLTPR